jgi:hypothetical protein
VWEKGWERGLGKRSEGVIGEGVTEGSEKGWERERERENEC